MKHVRANFTTAVKKAAWARCKGLCEACGKQLQRGRYRYDHRDPSFFSSDASLENCQVLCSGSPDSCDSQKTYKQDIPSIAQAKRARAGRGRTALQLERPAKRESTLQGQGFRPGHRPMRSRNTFARRER